MTAATVTPLDATRDERRAACTQCGQPKPAGPGRRLCDGCRVRRCSDCGTTTKPRGYVRGRCHRCYAAARRTGLVTVVGAESLAERILAHVEIDAHGCWLWTGFVDEGGYGSITIDGRTLRAHRVSYEAFVGPIPEGLQNDHLCRVRRCVNPAHLEPVTPRENTLRGESLQAKNARKTHCKRGHELTPDNVYVSKGTGRSCRTCVLDRSRARYASKAATR